MKKLILCFLILIHFIKCNDDERFSPTNVEKLNVKVLYNFNSDKWDASYHLMDSVCQNYKKFGDRMTVEFLLIARVERDFFGNERCESSEECEDELAEACAETLAKDRNKFLCCRAELSKCFAESGITWEAVQRCVADGYNTDAGKLLLENRKKLEKADIDEGPLPALVFNDEKYNKYTDNAAYDDFVRTVCQLYAPAYAPKPPC